MATDAAIHLTRLVFEDEWPRLSTWHLEAGLLVTVDWFSILFV